MQTVAPKEDPLIHALIDTDTDKAVGVASYLRVNADAGTIEVGGLAYSPLLQRRPAATRGHVSDDAAGIRRARLSPL